MSHAVAFTLEQDQMSMVYKPVYHGCCHLFICEYTTPFREFQIGCQYQTLALVAVGHNSEEQLRALLVYRYISPFILCKVIYYAKSERQSQRYQEVLPTQLYIIF